MRRRPWPAQFARLDLWAVDKNPDVRVPARLSKNKVPIKNGPARIRANRRNPMVYDIGKQQNLDKTPRWWELDVADLAVEQVRQQRCCLAIDFASSS